MFVGNDLQFEGYTGNRPNPDRWQGLHGTGDVGHLDEEGRLHLTGRADDMIVSGGENVHPGPVEELIANTTGVREVVRARGARRAVRAAAGRVRRRRVRRRR